MSERRRDDREGRPAPSRLPDPLADYRLTPEQQKESARRLDEDLARRLRKESDPADSLSLSELSEKAAAAANPQAFPQASSSETAPAEIWPPPISSVRLSANEILGLASGVYRSPNGYRWIVTAIFIANLLLFALSRAPQIAKLPNLAGPLATVTNVGFVAGGLTFLLLTRRFYENLSGFHAAGLCTSSTMAPWWFFIPVGSLWYPHRIYQDIWQASDPDLRDIDPYIWRLKPKNRLISVWWIACLLQGLLGSYLRFYPAALPPFVLSSWVDYVVVGVLTIAMIGSISARQERKHNSIEQAQSARGLPYTPPV